MKINKRYRVEIGDYRRLVIMLVGCGGSGSFAALHLARLAYVAKQKNISLKLVFVDPDTVEEKNIGRQNFAPAEIGLNKAYALAGRHNLAFGLEIAAVAGQFKQSLASEWRYNLHNGDILLLVGAVDNAAARRKIAGVSTHRQIWWLDAGNDLHSGQVLDRKSVV
jgi:PRTRC genetic system ThiF family protein